MWKYRSRNTNYDNRTCNYETHDISTKNRRVKSDTTVLCLSKKGIAPKRPLFFTPKPDSIVTPRLLATVRISSSVLRAVHRRRIFKGQAFVEYIGLRLLKLSKLLTKTSRDDENLYRPFHKRSLRVRHCH